MTSRCSISMVTWPRRAYRASRRRFSTSSRNDRDPARMLGTGGARTLQALDCQRVTRSLAASAERCRAWSPSHAAENRARSWISGAAIRASSSLLYRDPIYRRSRSSFISTMNRLQGVPVMRTRLLLLGTAISFLVVGPAAAQQRQGPPGSRRGAPGAQPGAQQGSAREGGSDSAGAPPIEKVSTTQHTITVDGKAVAYTARAGTMVLRDSTGKPDATVFYISYTKDGVDPATRPVTFFFNGGPGSASIWLDEGIMSPKHPDMGPAGSEPAPPYDLVDNPNTPLDVTDLVQVDAMMTGYSRPAEGVKAPEFTGAVNDVAMFGQFIRDYLDKYDRWASPKYLFGESYGTFRSAGLASELQEREGIELN